MGLKDLSENAGLFHMPRHEETVYHKLTALINLQDSFLVHSEQDLLDGFMRIVSGA